MVAGFANLGQELAWVAASGASSKGLAVRRRQREHLAETIVLSLEDFDAALEIGQVGSTASTEGTLDIASTVRRQVIIALTAALRGRNRWDV